MKWMRRLPWLFTVLFFAQSYGMYGAMKASKVTVDCKIPLWTMCFDWQPNELGEALGEKGSIELERSIEEAERAFETEVVERVKRLGDGGLDGLLDRIKEGIGPLLDR